ncbi:lipoprotein nlpI precursor [Vibrio ishigakensis]|uniref:Lipoprotein nlpI n=1 Tax=Vibrio ishigakensis TaxID=1481914 RepID=A0A0B8QJB8_9VIBR|nr:lipoprotein nlpI precursor [Vibrio ishigakensis]
MQGQQWAPPLAVPLQPSIQQEVQIARTTQLLLQEELNKEQRAELHFQRGVYYDSLGLRELARYDFNQSYRLILHSLTSSTYWVSISLKLVNTMQPTRRLIQP